MKLETVQRITESGLQQVLGGVTQSTVLGPFLFLLYVNDMIKRSTDLDFHLFAKYNISLLLHAPIYINLNLNWVWRTRLTSLVLQSKSIVLKKRKNLVLSILRETLRLITLGWPLKKALLPKTKQPLRRLTFNQSNCLP